METYLNPYTNETFFGFFFALFQRVFALFTNKIGFHDLVSDEIQILVLAGVSISAGLVGSFLVLRKMTMLANSLSHTILIGIVFTYWLTQTDFHSSPSLPLMLFASVLMGIVTTFLTQFLTGTVKVQEDASTGIVFTSLFALGIISVTILTRSAHIGTEVVMGNVDALQLSDCGLVYLVAGLNLILFLFFFKEYKITTFDPALSRALGISTPLFNYLLMVQTSGTVIAGFRAVGVLMVLALITGPALMARLLTHDLKKLILLATGIGIGCSVVGVALSRHLLSVYGTPMSTSGLVVCVIVVMFIGVLGVKRVRARYQTA